MTGWCSHYCRSNIPVRVSIRWCGQGGSFPALEVLEQSPRNVLTRGVKVRELLMKHTHSVRMHGHGSLVGGATHAVVYHGQYVVRARYAHITGAVKLYLCRQRRAQTLTGLLIALANAVHIAYAHER